MAEDERRGEIFVPDELAAGAYANAALVWHSAYEFTLDFAVSERFDPESDEFRCRVVTRVRIPPTMIFDLIRTLNDNMTKYETTFGEIRPVQHREGGEQDDAEG